MKSIFFVQFLLLIISQLYAQFDFKNYDPTVNLISGVKTIKRTYLSIEDQGSNDLVVFKYNNQNRLIKNIKYSSDFKNIISFTIYNYDKNGNLIEKVIYSKKHYPPFDFHLSSKIIYCYYDGLIKSEKELCPKIGDSKQTRYEYCKHQLISKSFYTNNNLEYKAFFKYVNNRIVFEIPYKDDQAGKDTIKYIYKDNLLTEVQFCNGGGFPSKRAYYKYNKKGKIIFVKIHKEFYPYIENYNY